jgi:hypothetical protein
MRSLLKAIEAPDRKLDWPERLAVWWLLRNLPIQPFCLLVSFQKASKLRKRIIK